MKLQLGNTELLLPKNGLLRLERARGLRIRCMAGRIWVTIAGRFDDVFLGEGESMDVLHSGVTLLEALHASRIALDHAGAIDCC